MLVNMHHARNTCDPEKLQHEIVAKGIALYGAHGIRVRPVSKHDFDHSKRIVCFTDADGHDMVIPGLYLLKFREASVYFRGTPETFQALMLDTKAWKDCRGKYFVEQFTLDHPTFGPYVERYLQGEEIENWTTPFQLGIHYHGFETIVEQYLATLPTPMACSEWAPITNARLRVINSRLQMRGLTATTHTGMLSVEEQENYGTILAEWDACSRTTDEGLVARKNGLYGTTVQNNSVLYYALPSGYIIEIDHGCLTCSIDFSCTAQDARQFMEASGLMAHKHELEYRITQIPRKTNDLADVVLDYITGQAK